MKLKNFVAALAVVLIACNNDASVQDRSDSATQKGDSNQSSWPKPGNVLGGDSLSSPATQTDSPTTTLKK